MGQDRIGMGRINKNTQNGLEWNGCGLLVRIVFFAQLFSFFWRLIFSLLVIFRGAAGGI